MHARLGLMHARLGLMHARLGLILGAAASAAAAAGLEAVAAFPAAAGFLPPVAGSWATGGELGAPFSVPSADACAAACLANASCISFNTGAGVGLRTCGIQGECYAPNASSCPSALTLSCPGGVFSSVAFASYGLPRALPGSCAYARNPACDAPRSAAVLAAACVGRSLCSVEIGVATFGEDPCRGEYKFFAASLLGNCSAVPPPAGELTCQLNGYSRVWTNVSGGGDANASMALYQRLQPRNDTRIQQAVPYALTPPTGGVTLNGGVLGAASDAAVTYLTTVYTVDDLLFNFRKRAGIPQAPGAKCIGWDCRADWIEGSPAGLFLMGAGGHLRWRELPQLRAMMDELIEGIANCTEADGWLSAYTQAKMATDEHPDYTTSWTVHGFLEAAIAGNSKALQMIRAHMDVFNNHTLLPTFLPPDGGNWPYQVPLGPWPPGADNATSSGSGTMTGHTVYLIVQGIIHSTRLALSPVGTQADVDLVRNLYEEPWWLQALADKDLLSFGKKLFFSHNYQITGVEAYMDMYFLTGEAKYLQAVLGAWEMIIDPLRGWLQLGGSVAINEGDVYAAGSFHLEAGTNAAVDSTDATGYRHRDWQRHQRGPVYSTVDGALIPDPYPASHGHHHHHGDSHDQHHDQRHGDGDGWDGHDQRHGDGDGWDGLFPTGEFCGAVFWLRLNQRLHMLHPDNETFVTEIERELYNEGLAHLAPDGSGIRYFSFLNGVKEAPAAIATCCEGQGTRLYGSMQEYLFATTPSGGVYVDIYAPSTFTTVAMGGVPLTLTVYTAFPYGEAVDIDIELPAGGATFDLALRMPSWLATAAVAVTVAGAAWPAAGVPGSYLHLARSWSAGTTRISLTLAMAITAHAYTGVTQLPPYVRYGYTYGPTLLAATGPFNATLKSMNIHGVAGGDPSFMVPSADGDPLHWDVDGAPGVLFQPNWEIQQVNFSAFPCFDF